jgi:predicted exporter
LTEPGSTDAKPVPALPPVGNPVVAAVAAFLVPGLGHVYLRRWRRGLAFFLLVVVALWVGWDLHGNLYRVVPNEPLSILGTLGALGMGIPYFIFRLQGYAGDILSAGYEYGTAFLLTAGLMNWLLVLDAWDISRGKKE